MAFMVDLRIDKKTKKMLNITPSEISKELRDESKPLQPWLLRTTERLRSIYASVCTNVVVFSFTMRSNFTFLAFQKRKKTSKSGILEIFPSWYI